MIMACSLSCKIVCFLTLSLNKAFILERYFSLGKDGMHLDVMVLLQPLVNLMSYLSSTFYNISISNIGNYNYSFNQKIPDGCIMMLNF